MTSLTHGKQVALEAPVRLYTLGPPVRLYGRAAGRNDRRSTMDVNQRHHEAVSVAHSVLVFRA